MEQANVSEYASELSDISMLFVAQQTAVVASVPDSAVETKRIAGGNSTLPEAMARALGPAVHLSTPVSAISWDRSGAVVTGGERAMWPRRGWCWPLRRPRCDGSASAPACPGRWPPPWPDSTWDRPPR